MFVCVCEGVCVRVRVCACVFVGVSFVYAAVFGVYLLVIYRLLLVQFCCMHDSGVVSAVPLTCGRWRWCRGLACANVLFRRPAGHFIPCQLWTWISIQSQTYTMIIFTCTYTHAYISHTYPHTHTDIPYTKDLWGASPNKTQRCQKAWLPLEFDCNTAWDCCASSPSSHLCVM